eukprot:5035976-Amphidinium_carterae.1
MGNACFGRKFLYLTCFFSSLIKADMAEEQRMEIRSDAPLRTPALEELDLEACENPRLRQSPKPPNFKK